MTWVEDRIYAAGGEHIPQTWAEFAHQTGIAAVLHLRPGAPASFQGPPPEAYLWLGLEDETEAGLAERWLAAAFVRDSLGAGRKVLIHSSLGRHRTRWIFVAWAIVDGRSTQTALRLAAARPWLSPYPTQPEAWEAFAREVRRVSRRPGPQGRTHALQ